MTNKVFVLIGKYSDNSGFEVVRVYSDKERADIDLAIFEKMPSYLKPELYEVDFIDDYGE